MSLFSAKVIQDTPAPKVGKVAKEPRRLVSGVAITRAHKVAARVERLAARIPATLAPGDCLHVVSHGDWCVADLLEAVLIANFKQPAALYLSTWSVSDAIVRQVARLKDSGRIGWIVALFDIYARTQKQAAFAAMETLADSWAVRTNHSKVYALISEPEGFGVSIVSSANLTTNRRIEAGTVTCDLEIARFHAGWITDAINSAPPFDKD